MQCFYVVVWYFGLVPLARSSTHILLPCPENTVPYTSIVALFGHQTHFQGLTFTHSPSFSLQANKKRAKITMFCTDRYTGTVVSTVLWYCTVVGDT